MMSNCYVCGGKMREVRATSRISMGSRAATVNAARLRCEKCGEEVFTPKQMDAAQVSAARALRQAAGLLAPAKIREIRQRYRLTQAELEALLGVGPKSVVRWERGTVCQSGAADTLLRLLDSSPFVFEHLAQKSEVRSSANIRLTLKGDWASHRDVEPIRSAGDDEELSLSEGAAVRQLVAA